MFNPNNLVSSSEAELLLRSTTQKEHAQSTIKWKTNVIPKWKHKWSQGYELQGQPPQKQSESTAVNGKRILSASYAH